MSEYGPVRAAFELDRLADLAASLGYSRCNDTETKPTAPGTVAAVVER
jgi:hypothetical protein